eukprot:TRINITY_DN9256_c0_g1_i1.p1 TRINITY_DN9256_c0_g1~~TRINITY_DN9256_c0_g1_i1.p1  ORF type:complete len:468 (-),score=96.81 TRINITY_DN9256_c0_g1_i1:267-1550(-)
MADEGLGAALLPIDENENEDAEAAQDASSPKKQASRLPPGGAASYRLCGLFLAWLLAVIYLFVLLLCAFKDSGSPAKEPFLGRGGLFATSNKANSTQKDRLQAVSDDELLLGRGDLIATRNKANSTQKDLLPVVMLHGMMKSEEYFSKAQRWLLDEYPSTQVFALNVLDDTDTLTALWSQVAVLSAEIRKLKEAHPEEFAGGYNLLCHSLGALLCRSFVQLEADHGVHTLVAVAGPQLGVYGDTWLENFGTLVPGGKFLAMMQDINIGLDMQHLFHDLAYLRTFQESYSIPNLWADPLHWDEFLRYNEFLPVVNGLKPYVERRGEMRANFAKLRKAAFLVGSFENQKQDGPMGLEPWQTGVFTFMANGTEDVFVPMQQQEVYLEDTFGLRTLDKRGDLYIATVEGIGHHDWFNVQSVFSKELLPLLA